MTPDEVPVVYWEAIRENDTAFDRLFFYGVQTTKIFCRPSCRSKVPNKKNVRIFTDVKHALAEDFRPCKRCKPELRQTPNEKLVNEMCAWIDQQYSQPITLAQLGDAFHTSPYHLQRTFKHVTGETPHVYIRKKRLQKARALLVQTDAPISQIGNILGFPNTSYFTTVFKKETSSTPNQFRQHQKNRSGAL